MASDTPLSPLSHVCAAHGPSGHIKAAQTASNRHIRFCICTRTTICHHLSSLCVVLLVCESTSVSTQSLPTTNSTTTDRPPTALLPASRHGHAIQTVPRWRTYLRVSGMQDAPRHHPLHGVAGTSRPSFSQCQAVVTHAPPYPFSGIHRPARACIPVRWRVSAPFFLLRPVCVCCGFAQSDLCVRVFPASMSWRASRMIAL